MSLFDDASLILTPNAYKVGKAYSLKPFDRSGDFTVVRNTTATYRDENGLIQTALAGEPRLNYPIGGGCPSWLIEGQSTNLVTYSNEFTNANWSKTELTVVGQKLIPTSVFSSHLIRKTLTTTTTGKQTMSIEAKADGYNFIRFWEDASTGRQCFFDLLNGTATNSNMDSVSIIPLSDGYYKCIATVTVGAPSPFGFRVNVTPDGTTIDFSGNGIDGVIIRNAQLETGLIATSYIPTTTSAVTRNRDIAGNSNISNLLNSDEGTLFFHVKDVFSFNYTSKILGIDDGGAVSNFFGLYVANPNNGMVSIRNRQANADLTNNVINDASNIKVAIKFGSFGLKTYLNGSLFSSSTTPYSGFATNLNIAIENNAFFKLENLMLFQTALSDTQLQEITTI